MSAALPPAIEELIARFCNAWRSHDVEALTALWDVDESHVTYVAEEIPGVFVGVEAIRDYWWSVFERFRNVEVFLQPLTVNVLDGVAWLLGLGEFCGLRLMDGTRVRTDGVRVGMVLRLTTGGWKVVHYMEAPPRGR